MSFFLGSSFIIISWLWTLIDEAKSLLSGWDCKVWSGLFEVVNRRLCFWTREEGLLGYSSDWLKWSLSSLDSAESSGSSTSSIWYYVLIFGVRIFGEVPPAEASLDAYCFLLDFPDKVDGVFSIILFILL